MGRGEREGERERWREKERKREGEKESAVEDFTTIKEKKKFMMTRKYPTTKRNFTAGKIRL